MRYSRHLDRHPHDVAIRVQLGHAYSEAGDFARAERAYAAADTRRPGDADLLLCWGHLRRRAGDAAGAIDLYGRSFAIDGNDDAATGVAALTVDEMPPAAEDEQPAEPMPEPEPEPEPEPQPEPEPEPQPEPEPAGLVEHCHDCTVAGFLLAPDGPETTSVEFRVGDRLVGRAAPGWQRHDGSYSFKTLLDVTGEAMVTAVRRPDGVPLANSPIHLSNPVAQDMAPPFAWAAAATIVKPFAMPPRGEVALFVTHARSGALKPHVAPYLRALRDEGIAVLLVAVVDHPLNLPEAVLDCTAGAMVRANAGYDFAAWAHALRLHPELYGASILYLINDSMSAPRGGDAFARLIGRVRASDAALVGLTESQEYRWHLQSYFMALKADLLSAYALHQFFREVRLLGDKDAVIAAYEVPFAAAMEDSGHRVEVLFQGHGALNPTLYAWRGLIADGFPFMKLLPLRDAFPEVDVTGWRAVLAEAGFDVGLIEATIRASEEAVPLRPDDRLVSRPAPRLSPAPASPLPKVAFFGPWNYDNGLGSAARGIIAALRRTGVPLNLHPVLKPFHVHRPLAPPANVVDFVGPADIAIVHLNPDSWHLLTDEQRATIATAGRRIGYWVWEMGHIPPGWWRDFGSVDRIWAPSRYCAELFAAQDEAPVDVIPHPVPLPAPPTGPGRAAGLARLGLPADRRIILYVFDGSSYLVRKNPAALIRAFAASGLGDAGWTLLLKTKHLMDRPEEGRDLRDLAASTAGVSLVDRALSAEALAELLALADIYASPHCSEGFGLTIAEAMAAGKPVVATDFGGSTDYLDAASGYPVKAHPWRLDEDFGHYARGGEWARIDEPALSAALTRAAAAVAAGDRSIGEAARARVAGQLSYDAVAGLIAASLDRTTADHGRERPLRHQHPALTAGSRIEAADLGPEMRAVALAADGSTGGAAIGVPEGLPADRDHWVALAPAGTRLHPLFARIVLDHAATRPDVAIFYGDDFAVDTIHAVDQLRLKPAFDITLLTAQDYIGAPLAVRASALATLGGLRAAARTAAADDLLLRAHAAGLSIARIPQVLAAHAGARPRALTADRRAVLATTSFDGRYELVDGRAPDTLALRRRFAGEEAPPVTILVPTRRSELPDGGSYIARLLAGIARADWPMDRLTVIVGDDVTGEPDWRAGADGPWPFTLHRIETPRAADEPFNYSAKMNRLWRAAADEHLVFMNDDVCPIGPGWLKALMTFATDCSVGGVGARLLYADGRLQHAGIAPHRSAAAHMWIHRRRLEGSYQDWAVVQREWSMVTGAVFATRRTLMEQVGGFDEAFSLEFNDVDLCLRLRMMGYRIVCTPDAEMTHVEKASRGETPPPGDTLARFLDRWREWLDDDPAWHPRLRRDRLDVTPVIEPETWYY